MGRKVGERITPTVSGTPMDSVSALAITTASIGPSLPRSSAMATMAAVTENVKMEPPSDRPSQPAKVGRGRGRESPIPESAARAARTGRNAPSPTLCTPMSAGRDSCRNPEDSVLHEPRRARTSDRSDNGNQHYHRSRYHRHCSDGLSTAPGIRILERLCAINLDAGRPLLCATKVVATGEIGEERHAQPNDHGDNERCTVAAGFLRRQHNPGPNEEDRQSRGERNYRDHPQVPRPVPIPRPLPEAVHSATLDAEHIDGPVDS